MKTRIITKISKFYFSYEDIARALGISPSSARVTANRYVRQGILVRLKRNLYMLEERWNASGTEERFTLANLIQVPSYISLMTALDYYEITTQVQRDFYQSVAVKWTKEVSIENAVFNYTKINKKLYFGFERLKGFFIATPEKAFLDAMYLMSLGRYSIDLASVDTGKLDMVKLRHMSRKFPQKTRNMLEKNEYIKKA